MRGRGYHGAAVHPILFRVGSYEVPSYGVALALAFALGIEVARRRARAAGHDEQQVIDVCMVILIASLVGARALWVATHVDAFRAPGGSFWQSLNPLSLGGSPVSGLSMLGGVGLATAATVAWLARRGLAVLPTADLLAPSVALGEGVTRLGCFLNGCCSGLPCDRAFCVRFPAGSGAGELFPGQAVHATQLYASALGFVGFALLSALWRRRPFEGAAFFALLAWVGLSRLGLDLVRHHDATTVLARAGGWLLTSNDALALGFVAAGAAGLAWARRRAAPGARTAA
jgi:phosphatidylglycerol:prolipoprotein diacylglycerol transferase